MANLVYFADAIGEHRAITPEGYLIARGVPISRTGWQQYLARELQGGEDTIPALAQLNPSAAVNVYRDERDVFDAAAISSFEGKSITKNHPTEGFLSHNNDRNHAIGHVQNVRRGNRLPDGEYALIADLWFKDAQSIVYIQNGVMDELSCGYTYKLVAMDDEHSPYTTYRMTEIRGNHVALVPSGRAGSYVKVLDASPEGSTTVKEELVALGSFFKDLGLRLVANDAESERVTEQHKKDAEALQLKERTMDEETVKKDKEASDKRLKDAEEKIEEVKKEASKQKEAVDAGFKSVLDAIGKLKDSAEPKFEDAKCTCDAEEGEGHETDCPAYDKKGAKDSDLIPTATLTGNEVPRNPIPGADSLVATLKAIRPKIADSGDSILINLFNRTMQRAKGKDAKPVNDKEYALLLDAAGVRGKAAEEALQRTNVGRVGDSTINTNQPKPGEYEAEMKKRHRVEPIRWANGGTA